ncbi:MAG: sigma-54-dependent Fis family transcriptional regulator [Acidobacteria bacterium]|nr:MAG: sigma-54-dependent Fis family transcriptional regulator [Acidobacteriota bacterium]
MSGLRGGDAGRATLLVVDDEAANRLALREVLEYAGYEVLEAADGAEGVRKAIAQRPDAILLDIRMPGLDGMEALKKIRASLPEVPVLMISGHGTIATAVEALRLGAEDFLEKPLEREVVLRRLARALERRRLEAEARARQADDEARWRLVGSSEAMQRVRRMIERAGPTQATVLVTGESGTGKELVARAIHRASRRRERPFVKVNCAAIPDELIESELFGHEKGAFTGASSRQEGRFVRAHRGTIFLDEVGDMSLRTQAKVLRALQDGEVEPLGAGKTVRVDVRVIAATNKDLREEIEKGRFREDLYYRLNVLPIHLPPLRERREDIPELVEHLTALICRENNFKPRRFTREALAELASRPWPGNVRELRNLLERAIVLAPGDTIDVEDLPRPDDRRGGREESFFDAETLREFKERAERAFLLRKLEENDWNITRTAQAIGTPRSNLYKKLEHHELERLAANKRSETP